MKKIDRISLIMKLKPLAIGLFISISILQFYSCKNEGQSIRPFWPKMTTLSPILNAKDEKLINILIGKNVELAESYLLINNLKYYRLKCNFFMNGYFRYELRKLFYLPLDTANMQEQTFIDFNSESQVDTTVVCISKYLFCTKLVRIKKSVELDNDTIEVFNVSDCKMNTIPNLPSDLMRISEISLSRRFGLKRVVLLTPKREILVEFKR